jgi:predicted dehydrogenase
MVNIAMLSFAHTHARGYADQVQHNPDAQIVAVWDEEEYGGKEAAKDYNVPFYADLDAVFNLDEVDAVVVNAPTVDHPKVMIAAAESGKHIFTEKALAITVNECDEIIGAVEKAGVKFMISLPSRCNPGLLLAKRAVDDGLLGDLTFGRGRIAHAAAVDGWLRDTSLWFADAKRSGGGALFDLGCHRMDVIPWLMGTPKSVIAKINNRSGNYPIDDNSASVIEFENSSLGVVDVSWVHRYGPNMLELYGTDGSIVSGFGDKHFETLHSIAIGHENMHFETRKLSEEEKAEYVSTSPPPPPPPIQQWINAILHEEPTTITIQDGRNLTELMQACYQSAERGRSVELPL